MAEMRPWGEYIVTKQIKMIYINPHECLSSQYHNHRDETWQIIDGFGIVEINNKRYPAVRGQTFHIKKGEQHRAFARDLEFVIQEFSEGDVEETDIVRLEDKYGRT